MWRHFPPPQEPLRHSWGPDVFHAVFTVAILALLVILAVWLITSMRKSAPLPAGAAPPAMSVPATPPQADNALVETRMRYARGEIDRDEFLRISQDLGAKPPAAEG